MSDPLTGGCLCGAVRYTITAAPLRSGYCHCKTCQRLSGAGRSPLAVFPEQAVEIEGAVTAYASVADSGANVRSEFCPVCGSPLFGRNDRMNGLVVVRLGSLDDPEAVSPQMEIFTSRRITWEALDESRACFTHMPSMGD